MVTLKSFSKKLKSDITGGLDLLSAGFSHPLLTIRDPLSAVKRTKQEGALQTSLRTVRNTAIVAAPLVGAARTAILSAAASPKNLLLGTGLIGAAIASPKVRTGIDVATDPTTAFRAGKLVGGVVEGKTPNISSKDALKTAGIVGAGAVIAGGVIAGTKKAKGAISAIPKLAPELKSMPSPQVIGGVPVEPQTTKKRETPTTKITVKPTFNISPPKTKILINNVIQSI